jgi:hypothetical protein
MTQALSDNKQDVYYAFLQKISLTGQYHCDLIHQNYR